MDSGADVEAFTAELNRDIEAALSQGNKQTASQFLPQWQTSGHDGIVNFQSGQDLTGATEKEHNSSQLELHQHGSDSGNRKEENDSTNDTQPSGEQLIHIQEANQERESQMQKSQNTSNHMAMNSNNQQPVSMESNDQQSLSRMSQHTAGMGISSQQAGTSGMSQQGTTLKFNKHVPIGMLFHIIQPQLDKDRAMQLQTLYVKLKKNEISKDGFARHMRSIVEDQMLKMAVYKLQTQAAKNSQTASNQFQSQSQAPGRPSSGMAEQNARMQRAIEKKIGGGSRRPGITGSSSGAPRLTRGGNGPQPTTRPTVPTRPTASTSQMRPTTAFAKNLSPTPLQLFGVNIGGPSRLPIPTVQVSDESSGHESALQERRKKVRYDCPTNLLDLQNRTGGASHSPIFSLDIVNQYEAYLLRDRIQYLGNEERPAARTDRPTFVPDWRINSDSSILSSNGIRVASEVMRNAMLPADKAQFINIPTPGLEDIIHEGLAKASLAAHSMSLVNSFLRHENSEIQRSYDEYRTRLDQELEKARMANSEVEEARQLKIQVEALTKENEQLALRMAELELTFSNLKSDSLEKEEELETMKVDFEACKVELVTAKAEAAKSYEEGKIDGWDAFLNSSEYKRSLDEARFNGAQDFKNSTTFEALTVEPSASFIYDGFMKAVDYMMKDDLVIPEFDPVSFERLASATALRPSSVDPSPAFIDFPEFRNLGPIESDDEKAEIQVVEGDEAQAPEEARIPKEAGVTDVTPQV